MTPTPQEQLDTRAIEVAAETSGILRNHLSHHDRMEQDAAVERRDLRNSISKVHVRLNQVGLLLIVGLLGLVGYMLVNPLPWVEANILRSSWESQAAPSGETIPRQK